MPSANRLKFLACPFCCFLLAIASPRTAFAQVDLAGEWTQKWHEDAVERDAGPEIGDYTGMPINDAARMRADSWDAQKLEMVEHLCDPHPADYAPRGPADMLIWSDTDPFTQDVVAWHLELRYMLSQRIIYMDGRPHPSENAQDTWQGFSTGEWEGDMLKVTTTHLKEGWLRRNGLTRSEKGTLTEYFIRHGDFFTLVTDVEDPVYMTEPLIRTSNWILSPPGRFHANYCIPSDEVNHPEGYVAHHLPGENPFLTEFRPAGAFRLRRLGEARRQCIPSIKRSWRKCRPRPNSPSTTNRSNEHRTASWCWRFAGNPCARCDFTCREPARSAFSRQNRVPIAVRGKSNCCTSRRTST